MSAISSREKNMMLIMVVIVLYAAAALSFKKQVENWKREQKIYLTAQKKLREEKALIAARGEWTRRYEEVCDLMPVFPKEKDVDTHWLNVMDSAATRNGLTISRRQANKETEVGDVFELPIDCKDWEGTLESLVKFLYDLHQEGAMLDMRQLYIRPSNKPGYLKGTFTLYCAYMRGDVEKPASSASAVSERLQTPEAPAAGQPAGQPAGEAPAEAPAMSPPAEGGAPAEVPAAPAVPEADGAKAPEPAPTPAPAP